MAEIDRKSRDSQSREKTERRNDWKPPSALDAPEAPIGYKHRWIRESVMEYDDKNNIHKRRREGYELVKAEDYPDFDAPVIDEGKNAGVIGTGGLLLAAISTKSIFLFLAKSIASIVFITPSCSPSSIKTLTSSFLI